MNVETIEMSRYEAADALRAFRRTNLENATREDQLLARCYRQMARGRRVLNLSDAVARGGFDEDGFPRLAVAHADQSEVWFLRRGDGEMHFARDQWYRVTDRHKELSARASAVPADTIIIPGPAPVGIRARISGRAIVPLIPARFRPVSLAGYLLLWEADWHAAPVDPFLLKPLGNGLCAVIAAWDLTPLERMVIGATRAVRAR